MNEKRREKGKEKRKEINLEKKKLKGGIKRES